MYLKLVSVAVLVCMGTSALASYPVSQIPSADVVNQVKDVMAQYALAVDSKNWNFSNFCSAEKWYSNYAGLVSTNLSDFEAGHSRTLPPNTVSQHMMDVKYVYRGASDQEAIARTYVIAFVQQNTTNATFTDHNVYDDLLRLENGSWKIQSRNASVLVRFFSCITLPRWQFLTSSSS